jgi:hypothetical protein
MDGFLQFISFGRTSSFGLDVAVSNHLSPSNQFGLDVSREFICTFATELVPQVLRIGPKSRGRHDCCNISLQTLDHGACVPAGTNKPFQPLL